jgi:hypothetical protein
MNQNPSVERTFGEAELFCANHPTVATQLRRNRRGKAIAECAVRTPVGYRCRECVREQQQVFETATTIDYPIAFLISAVASLFATWALSFLGFFGLFVAPAIGVGVAEVVRRAVRGHRARHLPTAAVAGAILGAVPVVGGLISDLRRQGDRLARSVIWPTVYAFSSSVRSTGGYGIRCRYSRGRRVPKT